MEMVAERDVQGLRGVGSVLVVGLGVSGRAAADSLLREGKKVTVSDIGETGAIKEAADELSARGAEAVLGRHDLSLLEGMDLVVVSPGVTPRLPLLKAAQEQGIPVWSEVELASRLLRGPMVAVTGTNGKTTTVRMIERICRRAGRPAVAAGNIGYPLITAAEEAEEGTLLVAEVSSFQLYYTYEFRPQVAVLLNIAEDHFDWHSDMREYTAAKSRIWANQEREDAVICNLDDTLCVRASLSAPSRVLYYSRLQEDKAAVFMRGEAMLSRIGGGGEAVPEPREIMLAEKMLLPGVHNLENAMAAAGAAITMGIEPEVTGEALASFRGLPHRLQFAGETGGVRFYNDSKATNPHATLRALESFPVPLALILGGRNKGLSFEALAGELGRRGSRGDLRAVYLIGEAAGEIAEAIEKSGGRLGFRVMPGLEEVFESLRGDVVAGDVVLFSPACTSFDRYNDFKERGRHFQAMVDSYREKGAHSG